MNKREHRGKSVIKLPDSYCVVDIETTGLKPEYAEIIELGAVNYENGEEVGRFQQLVKPRCTFGDERYVTPFIEDLTGINDDMLRDAPRIEEVLPHFEEFLSDNLIMGYNAAFDVNFIYDALMAHFNKPLTNDFVDVLRIARKVRKELPGHSLKNMTDYYGIVNINAHRAVSDCVATHECYQSLRRDILSEYGEPEIFINTFAKKNYRASAADIKGDPAKFDPESPIFEKRLAFSGPLRLMNRTEAMRAAADKGALPQNAVTGNTDFLVLSDSARRAALKGAMSRNRINAAKYESKILSEGEFYAIIGLWNKLQY